MTRCFWDLIPFTLQMSLIMITGQVLATSPPMGRLIRRVAGWPESPRAAVALVTLFALASPGSTGALVSRSASCSLAKSRAGSIEWITARSRPLVFWAWEASGRKA